MLDRLDRAFARQRRFVSDASHELRSPLTAIRGQLEVLARDEHPSPEDVRQVEAVAMTRDGAGRTAGRGPAGAGPPRRGRRPGAARGRGAPPSCATWPTREPARRPSSASWPRARSSSTPTCSPRSSATCSPTPTATPGRRAGSCSRRGRRRCSWSRRRRRPGHPGRAARARLRPLPPQRAPRATAPPAAAASAWRSPARSSTLHGGRIWIEDSPLGGARVGFELPGFAPG